MTEVHEGGVRFPATESADALRVIVDTDLSLGAPGSEIDDGLALAMVVVEPKLDLQAVTTVSGNVDAAHASSLVLDLFRRLSVRDVPVFRGAMSGLCDATPLRSPSVTGGQKGESFGEMTTEYAAPEIARRIVEAPGEITLIALGPLTNVAVAINLEPRLASAVREIVVMGGTYFRDLSWGSLPSEFNFWSDPEAARVVLRSGARLRLVGLDVTTQVKMARADAQRLRDCGGGFVQYLGECALAWIERLAREYPGDPDTGDSCAMHDPLTVAAVVRPDLLQWHNAYVDIVTHDELGRGKTVVDRLDSEKSRPANCSLSIGVDAKAARDYVFGLLSDLYRDK